LEQKHGALRRPAPHKLAAFTLAVLHVDIAAGILQAAISKRAVNKDTIVEHEMLVFEDLVLVSNHGDVRLSPATTPCKCA
jgi:hypothetical protein